jgi:hypothetical protein
MTTTNSSQRFGVNKQQGIGFSKNSGEWLYPEARTGSIKIIDDQDQIHSIVLDFKTGLFYDITLRDGPTTTGLTIGWKDKVNISGVGGTDITSTIKFREDMGTFEHNFIKHLGSNFYFRPIKETLRSTSGYDTKGMPSGIGIDVSIYQDGEPTTPISISDNISTVSETVFDRHAEGHRLQTQITADMAPFSLVGRQQYYVSTTKPETPDTRINTEGTNQLAFASPSNWWSRYDYAIDRAVGTISTLTPTYITGPDSESDSAISFSTTITIGSITLASAGILLFWHQNISNVLLNGVNINSYQTQVTTSGSWILSKIIGYGPVTGNLVFQSSGNGKLFDIRNYTTIPTATQLTYYYNDIIQNNGNNVI